MNILDELGIHVESLMTATAEDPKFFASVINYVRQLHERLLPVNSNLSREEVALFCRKIEEFWAKYRPDSDQGWYFPTVQTTNTDGTVREMVAIAGNLQRMSQAEFEALLPFESGSRDIARHKTPTNSTKLDVFISHSAKDSDIAEALIALLRASLNLPAERIRCTSVDGYRLPAGVETDEQLKREVRGATCFIALLTPYSLHSAYVLFEMGARWGAKLHLLPFLARGSSTRDLSSPLSGLNALSSASTSQIHHTAVP